MNQFQWIHFTPHRFCEFLMSTICEKPRLYSFWIALEMPRRQRWKQFDNVLCIINHRIYVLLEQYPPWWLSDIRCHVLTYIVDFIEKVSLMYMCQKNIFKYNKGIYTMNRIIANNPNAHSCKHFTFIPRQAIWRSNKYSCWMRKGIIMMCDCVYLDDGNIYWGRLSSLVRCLKYCIGFIYSDMWVFIIHTSFISSSYTIHTRFISPLHQKANNYIQHIHLNLIIITYIRFKS